MKKFAIVLWLGCSLALSGGAALADEDLEALWAEEATRPVAAPSAPDRSSVVTPSVEAQTGYRIGARDVLEIDVFRVPELTRKVRVDDRGRISLPLVGSLVAAGRTPEDLAAEIAARLSERYIKDPYVTVFVAEYESQRVTVEGSVNKPGIYPLKGRTTLLQVVAQAQGLTDLADARAVQVFRTYPDGRRAVLVFDVQAIRRGEAPDPVVWADDVVVVPRSGPRSLVRSVANTLRGFISFGTVPLIVDNR